MSRNTLSYRLDPSGVILSVGESFQEFSQVNGGQIRSQDCLGQSIWAFVQGPVLQACLKAFFERCRHQPGQLPYRCDSPGQLREWIVHASADAQDLQVSFRQVCSLERPSGGEAAARLERPLKFCSWCNALVEKEGCRWPHREEAELIAGRLLFCPRSVTHTLCDRCWCGLQLLDPAFGFAHLHLPRPEPASAGGLTEDS